MAENNYIRTQALEAGVDLTLKQNHFVNVTAGKAALPDANGPTVGVLTNAPDVGETADVMMEAGSKVTVVAGAVIAIGAQVTSNALGRAITAAGTTTKVSGIALNAAAADGDLITIIYQPAGFFAQA